MRMSSTELCITTAHPVPESENPARNGCKRMAVKRLRCESYFDNFVGSVRRGLKLPFAQRVLGCFGKHGMATLHFDGLYRAIGCHKGHRPYVAADVHGACEAGILWRNAGQNLADAIRRLLSVSGVGSERENRQQNN